MTDSVTTDLLNKINIKSLYKNMTYNSISTSKEKNLNKAAKITNNDPLKF